MVNILLEGYDIAQPWLFKELKNYIKPSYKVAVIAFSFRDSVVKNLNDWNSLYGKESGQTYHGIVKGLKKYGVNEENITFINYFTASKQSAYDKVNCADILYFTNGLPDRMMDRIKEFELYDAIKNHKGIVMGFSAGAVIQLKEYHLSPDHDYPEFSYYNGFGFTDKFYLEVHYRGTDVQNTSIKKVKSERNKTVYATELFSGAIIVDNGEIELIGDVKEF